MSGPFVDNQGHGWKWWSYHLKSAFAVLLSLAILITVGVVVYRGVDKAWVAVRTTEDYIGAGKEPVKVVIPQGSTMTDIGYILLDANVVKSMKAYNKAVAQLEQGQTIQAGSFQLKTEMPASAAVAHLADPKNRVVTRITIPEGYRLSRQFAIIAKNSQIKTAALNALASKPAPLNLPAYSGGKLEGFLFPDTYEIEDTTTAQQLLTMMVARYAAVTKELNFEQRAKATGITPQQALVIASILEREGNNDKDLQAISGVIRNRMKAGMPLQMDSTVHYATNTDSDGKVTTAAAQRTIKHPYNTYKVKGLPPGPISAPGKAALAAAVNPTKHAYLYFVTVNLDTGETAFASTLQAHNANVKKFQDWCQASDNRAKCG